MQGYENWFMTFIHAQALGQLQKFVEQQQEPLSELVATPTSQLRFVEDAWKQVCAAWPTLVRETTLWRKWHVLSSRRSSIAEEC